MFWGKCSFWWWFSLAWQNSIYETISSVVMCERFSSSYVNLVVHFQHLVTQTSDCTMTPTACLLAITVFENWYLLIVTEFDITLWMSYRAKQDGWLWRKGTVSQDFLAAAVPIIKSHFGSSVLCQNDFVNFCDFAKTSWLTFRSVADYWITSMRLSLRIRQSFFDDE